MAPVVSLSTAAKVSPCDDIEFDLSGSYGSGGKPWKSFVWHVTGPPNSPNISEFLNRKYNNDTGKIAVVPKNLLSAGTISFTLSLENFFSRTSVVTQVVTVTREKGLPRVTIAGPSVLSIYRWQKLSLSAIASLPSCASQDSALQYQWKVYNDIQYVANLQSASLDPRSFWLAAYSLDSATRRSIVVTVSSPSSKVPASATVTLNVGVAGVVSVLAGGGKRTLSATDKLFLDGSQSYDIDYPHDSSSLKYAWSCTIVSPNFGGMCTRLMVLGDGPINTVSASVLAYPTPTVYNMTLTVSNQWNYSSTAFTLVTVNARDAGTISNYSYINV